MASPSTFRAAASVLFALLFLFDSSPDVLAKGQTYTPRNQEEVEILTLLVASEIEANHWSKSELICLSINGLDPAASC